MAKIKARDLAYLRMGVPDLDQAEEFLLDFGLMKTAQTKDARYFRALDDHHHVYVAERGESRFKGVAFEVASEQELAAFAASEGLPVETLSEPGGGKCVRLRDPNGYTVELVTGIERVTPYPSVQPAINVAAAPLERAGTFVRLKKAPARVRRVGHFVMTSTRSAETISWYRDTLGLICSDNMVDEDNGNRLFGTFSRLDRGEEYVDHHVFFCMAGNRTGFNHIGFEVDDIDEVFLGHSYLQDCKRYEHMWGIGRHYLGSQVFDYWSDPWGRVHEHWSDSDRLNVASGSNTVGMREGAVSQWGPEPNPKIFDRICP